MMQKWVGLENIRNFNKAPLNITFSAVKDTSTVLSNKKVKKARGFHLNSIRILFVVN